MPTIRIHPFLSLLLAQAAIDAINEHYGFPKEDGMTLTYTNYWTSDEVTYYINADEITEAVLGEGEDYSAPDIEI